MTSSIKPNYKTYGTRHDDEEALIRASAEGLSGGQPSQLQEVLEVLKHLKCEDELNNNI